ncbi:MAG: hypothetical protein HC875_19420 [Anaerolineales bacterium]|nr:hypothetical protein [Anaerolineales bacterium]
MGLIRRKVKNHVVCNHSGASGDHCPRCGAGRNEYGGGYETRLVTIEQEFLEVCQHRGEFGARCSRCGDMIGLVFSKA